MKLSDIEYSQLAQQLQGRGLDLQIGPFQVRLRSDFDSVASSVAALYADYSVGSSDFADFHINVASSTGLRRWYHPQAIFEFDHFVPFKPLPASQAFPLFEWGLNWCIATNAHQYLIVHSAVLERDGHVAIMAGSPGAGKSTLCAGLASRGWRLLSDEMALVSLDDLSITPIPRPISLKNESIGVMKRFAPDAVFGQTWSDTHKGDVAHMQAPADSVRQATRKARARWLLMPRFVMGSGVQAVERSKGRMFMDLVQQTFNYNVLGQQAFDTLGQLVEECECFHFRYGSLSEAVDFFEQLLALETQGQGE